MHVISVATEESNHIKIVLLQSYRNDLCLLLLFTFICFLPFLAHLALGQVSYCYHFSSIVCRPSTFHILIFSSETTGPIATKLWWNGPWMAPFQNYVR